MLTPTSMAYMYARRSFTKSQVATETEEEVEIDNVLGSSAPAANQVGLERLAMLSTRRTVASELTGHGRWE